MKTEYQPTPEEEAYRRFFEANKEILSEAARTIFAAAEAEAYKFCLCRNYAYQPFEYDEAMDKMHLAATQITGRDRELFAKLWRSALAAASSVDPDDETPAGFRIVRGDLHRFNRMASGMVEEILQEKRFAESETGP